MSGPIVVGLDVGSTKICALAAELSANGAIEILGIGRAPSSGIRKGIVVDLAETGRRIREAVSIAEREAQVQIRVATVGLSGDHLESLNTQAMVAVSNPGGEITVADRDRVLSEAGALLVPPQRTIVHLRPRQFLVDGQPGIHSPIGMCGSRLEVSAHLVHAARSPLDNLARALQRAGLEHDAGSPVLASLASAEAVLSPEERSHGALVADLGGGTTDFVLMRDGAVVQSHVIPVGGWHVTHDLAVGLQISEAQAEKLKSQYGVLPDSEPDEIVEVQRDGTAKLVPFPRQLIREIIEPRIDELFQLMIDWLGESHEPLPPRFLVLTGGGALLPGIASIAERTLARIADQKTSERIIPGERVRIASPRCAGGLADKVASPSYATAVGLVQIAAGRMAANDPGDGGHLLSPVQQIVKRGLRGLFGSKHPG